VGGKTHDLLKADTESHIFYKDASRRAYGGSACEKPQSRNHIPPCRGTLGVAKERSGKWVAYRHDEPPEIDGLGPDDDERRKSWMKFPPVHKKWASWRARQRLSGPR
jgi:hypothetical protein